MKIFALAGLCAVSVMGLVVPAQAAPLEIILKTNDSLFPEVTILTDTKDLTVAVSPPDPGAGDPGRTFIAGTFDIGGPDPAPPTSSTTTQKPGLYTFFQEYDISIEAAFPVTDVSNFFVMASQLDYQGSTFKIASYEVFSDGTFNLYQDGPSPFLVESLQVFAIVPVPLPSSAPMLGAALLGMAGLGYAAKWRVPAAG